MATSTDLRAAIEEVQQQLPEDELGSEDLELGHEEDWAARIERRVGALPWWMISAVVHAVIFLLVTLLSVALPEPEKDSVVITTDVAKEKPPEYDPKKKRDIFKQQNEIQADTVVEKPILLHEEVEITDHFETADNMDMATAKGFEEAISDIPLGGTGVTGSIGVGGGGMAGVFGYRGGGGRKKAVARFGGSPATESAVEAALAWLYRHQLEDGGWAIGPDGTPRSSGSSRDNTKSHPAMTGLATLAFLGAGYTHKSGKYRDTVNRAIKWLISKQKDSGSICIYENSHLGYNHSMASMALVEAYGMTKDPELKDAAQKTVDYSIGTHQAPYSGWRYKAGQEGDISHTGWFIMQLKSAKVAGLQVDGAGFQGGMNFVNKLLSPVSGRSVYELGQASKYFMQGSGGAKGEPQRRTAISMVCRLFMGIPRDDEVMQKSAGWVSAAPPKWDEEDFYYWYYGTLGMFQAGGDHWKAWNEGLKPTLLDNQRQGGPMDGSALDVDGSWDYADDPYGGVKKNCGRVYTTALGALCLEVYYRYLPMYSK